MNKIFALPALLLLCGCVHEYNQKQIVATSSVDGTDIYLNGEYQGTNMTSLRIMNKHAKNSFVVGEKKSCKPATLQIEYKFDPTVFWVFNFSNIKRLANWDVYIVDEEKGLYNVTPRCED